jgi:hypothetical protein
MSGCPTLISPGFGEIGWDFSDGAPTHLPITNYQLQIRGNFHIHKAAG